MVEIFHSQASASSDGQGGVATLHRVLWDRKVDGGFPETKELKRRLRDVIEPGRSLGHVDRDYGTKSSSSAQQESEPKPESKKDEAVPSKGEDGQKCEDCG